MTLLTALSALSACSSSPPSPKAAYLTQANAICRDMQTEGQAITGPLTTSNDANAFPNALRQMSELVGTTVTKLRTLSPPPGDEATVDAAIDQLATAGQIAGSIESSAAGGATSVSSVVAAQTSAQSASDAAMSDYGLTDCVLGG